MLISALCQHLARFMLSHAAAFISIDQQLAKDVILPCETESKQLKCLTSIQCVYLPVLHVLMYA